MSSSWLSVCTEARRTVGLEPGGLLGHVILGQVGVDRQLDGYLGRLSDRFALQLGYRFGHHLAIEVVADGGDVPGLRRTQQVAGAPDLEVAHGNAKARAQLGGLADRLEPFVGLLG